MRDDIPELITFTDAKTLPSFGIRYPKTEHQLHNLFNKRHENGLADAFAFIGGRRLFKPRRYLELVRASSAA